MARHYDLRITYEEAAALLGAIVDSDSLHQDDYDDERTAPEWKARDRIARKLTEAGFTLRPGERITR